MANLLVVRNQNFLKMKGTTLVFKEQKKVFSYIGKECQKNQIKTTNICIEDYFVDNQGMCIKDSTGHYFILDRSKPLIIEDQIEISEKGMHSFFQILDSLAFSYIIVYWPKFTDLSIQEKMEKLTIRAISSSDILMKNNAKKLEKYLETSTRYRIVDEYGSNIEVSRHTRSIFIETYESLDKGKIIQYPGGEVFFAPFEGTTNGVICPLYKGNIWQINILNGVIVDDSNFFSKFDIDYKKLDIGEIGFGTNKDIFKQTLLPFSEKADGTWHIGFGENRNMGGMITAEYHFDLVLFGKPTIIGI
ncbi:hypothetical protein [Listeria innocua]|uniref:hypothetical protein n=1 Tax=Listeria innocua TaxID=1642 RepID=UPI001626A492|nr:hypothetical protein [Listeria innocua]MBC1925434.1 hypothetical protein [Listeria innocua]